MGFLSTQFANHCVDQADDCCPKKKVVCCPAVHEQRLCLLSGKYVCSCGKNRCKPKKSKKCNQCCPKFPKAKKSCC